MKTLEMFPGLVRALFALAVLVIGMGLFRYDTQV